MQQKFSGLVWVLIISFLMIPGCATPPETSLAPEEHALPKNIILFIGDGMGVSHITAAKIVKGDLNLERFNVVGLLTTHSQDALVTDSAAAGPRGEARDPTGTTGPWSRSSTS